MHKPQKTESEQKERLELTNQHLVTSPLSILWPRSSSVHHSPMELPHKLPYMMQRRRMTLNTVIPSSRQSLHGSITTGADILKRFVTGQGMYSASRGMSGMGDGLTTPGGAVELRISTPMMCLLRRPSRSRCAVSLPIAAAQWQRPTPKGIGKGNPASLHWTLLIDSVVPMNACFKGHFWWSWPMAHKDLSPDGTRENSRNQRSRLSNAVCEAVSSVSKRSMNDTTQI